MSEAHLVLVVDDTPRNVKLLADALEARGGYRVVTASSGGEALVVLEQTTPDIVLLDVVMPGMSGYEVCERIRLRADTELLPVVMVTALDPAEERIKGIEAGADDFIAKPINTPELLARVRSLLRIRELHQRVQTQADELARLNEGLEHRVATQVAELGRLEKLKRFFSPQIVEVIASDDDLALLRPHRRDVSVVFIDLRRFTAFAQSTEPEEVMQMLSGFHERMGALVVEHGGTLERFTGDGMMVFFNDPVEVDEPERRAVQMALDMRTAYAELNREWVERGWDLGFSAGIHCGYATLGVIGFEGRFDYAAVGTVVNQASRLCAEAADGQVLASATLVGRLPAGYQTKRIGTLELKGLRRPVETHEILYPGRP